MAFDGQAHELMARRETGLVTILDVRPEDEFALGHLPGAINVPLRELEKRLRQLNRRHEIVAYCELGKEPCTHSLRIREAAALRSQEIPYRRFNRGQHGRGQGPEHDGIDSFGIQMGVGIHAACLHEVGDEARGTKRAGVLVREAAAESDGVLQQPPPAARVADLGQGDVVLELTFWTDSRRADFKNTSSSVRANAIQAMKQHRIALPEPDVRRLVLRQREPEEVP